MVYDRAGEPAMDLGGYRSYFGNGSDVMHLHDLETGERRLGRMEDVAEAARLCDSLPEIDFVMSGAYPDGMDAGEAYPRQFRAMIPATTKPLVMTAGGVETVEPMWRMACEVRGGAQALREKPYFIMYNQPVTPLKHPFETVDKLLFCADKGVPSTYCPSPVAGGTAPITTPGQIDARRRRGAVRPRHAPAAGARGPVRHRPGPQHARHGHVAVLVQLAGVHPRLRDGVRDGQVAGPPDWGFAATDAQVVDAQAGMEADEITKLSMQLGANLNHDVGYMDFGLSGSLAEVVLVAEFISRNRQLLKAIEVDDETLAVDVIKAVGPGGDFLGQRHTRKHLRETQWRGRILIAPATTAGPRTARPTPPRSRACGRSSAATHGSRRSGRPRRAARCGGAGRLNRRGGWLRPPGAQRAP